MCTSRCLGWGPPLFVPDTDRTRAPQTIRQAIKGRSTLQPSRAIWLIEPHTLPRVWVRPVNPEEYPDFSQKQARPVTRSDLGDRFQAPALRFFRYDHPPEEAHHKFRLVEIGEDLDLYSKIHSLGQVIWPMWPFLFAENWKEAIDEIAARGLYLFDIWGYVPSNATEHYAWSEYRVSDQMHSYILSRLGHRFLGYDNGEQDGRYVGLYAKLVCPSPSKRQEAFEAFNQYFRQLGNDLQNYLVALNSLTFSHYFAKMGNHRLLGAETAQGLPSVPPWYAIIRGAGKQYGILWYGNSSVFNRWGYKSMDDPQEDDRREGGYLRGPTAGTSMSLLRRLWYVLVMYGSVMMSFEMGHLGSRKVEIVLDGVRRQVPALTEIGHEQLRGMKWCADHPDRGELHTPVALMWDFYAGWVPPRHLYTSDTYMVWGNMPYDKGDHQIDLILRELYPGYEDSSFYRNERGFLTPTPCGDIFDVLLSDARAEIIDRYECVLVLGDTVIQGDLLQRLSDYLGHGGRIIACANQLGRDAGDLFGVEVGESDEAYHAVVQGHEWPINEPTFRFHRIICQPGSEVLAWTRQGYPLAAMRRDEGGGSTLLFASDYMLSNSTLSMDKIHNLVDQPLPSPHSLLEHAKALLLPHLRSYNLVVVEGPPIQYMVNVTARTDRLLVTLCNNSPEPWCGTIRPRGATIRRATNLMGDEEIQADRHIRFEIPALDVRVIEILLSEPAFEVRG